MCQTLGIIDTNVVVSSFLNHNSIPGEIINMVLDGTIIPVLNGSILREYYEVLSRNIFNFSKQKVDEFITKLTIRAIIIVPRETAEAFIDTNDKVFYETLLAAQERGDSYLITGNKKDFPDEPNIVSPREMLEIIDYDFYRHD